MTKPIVARSKGQAPSPPVGGWTPSPASLTPRVAFFAALFTLGCDPDAGCKERIAVANSLARAHAPQCRFEPEALAKPECAGSDRRPELNYYATWCDLATLSCIRDEADDEVEALCFGEP